MLKKNLFLVAMIASASFNVAQAMDGRASLEAQLVGLERVQTAQGPTIDVVQEVPRVKLPAAKQIDENLCKGGFKLFVSMTNIDRRLGNQEMDPIYLSHMVTICLYRYIQDLHELAKKEEKNVGMRVVSHDELKKENDDNKRKRDEILKCILRNSPETYKKLCAYEESLGCNALQCSKL